MLRKSYKLGDWLVVCDNCGDTIYGSEAKKQWDGVIACQRCWNPRHPQDYVKAVRDSQVPPFTRPRPTDQFLHSHYVENDYVEPGYFQDL